MQKINHRDACARHVGPLPEEGFVRLVSILAPHGPIPVGRSTWWAGVKTGRFPKPVKLGTRTTVWKVEDIRKLIETAE
jgi:predicted DNA-binding transcriptional regulator AlpA